VELFERPHSRFVAEFMGLSNFIQAQVLGVDAAGSTLQAFGHAFEAPATGVKVGGSVQVALRPERIRLSPHAPLDSRAVPGQVLQAIYHGSASDYTVRLPDGSLLAVRQGHDTGAAHDAQHLAVGAPVWAQWQRAAVHILQA
jgi:ABC-type Fe3+/spermidine/putrescine transport system ATPase subunit